MVTIWLKKKFNIKEKVFLKVKTNDRSKIVKSDLPVTKKEIFVFLDSTNSMEIFNHIVILGDKQNKISNNIKHKKD